MSHGYHIAVYHCHQAVEKMLKAVLNEHEKDIPKIHHLVRLLGLTGLEAPPTIAQAIADLNPHYAPIRYPDLGFRPNFIYTYTRKNTEEIIGSAKQIIIWLKTQIQ
ncbi:MAG: HEPN domain-containing protein [Candidatus Magasanikbacteria bacterium]|nr:HEPN domain-containing protein [Candidatus Magasanikbacteria bacterium]